MANIIHLNDGQIRYYNNVWKNMDEKYVNNKFYGSIIRQLNQKKYLTRNQKYYLDFLYQHGQSPYEAGVLPLNENNIKETINYNDLLKEQKNNNIERKKFINILNKEDISYEIKDNKSIPLDGYEIIIDGNDIESDLITYIPDNIKFNNKGGVYLSYLKEMGNNIIFNNKGFIDLSDLNKIGNNIIFNNNGKISLYSLKEVGNNIIFNNKGDVWLDTIYYFDIYSVKFTNNVEDVIIGNETFWMNYFPYQIYPNIKGNFRMWNDKKNKWEIIKEQYINYNDLLNEQELLLENRVEDARKKYSDKLDRVLINRFIDIDPSGNQKYLDGLLKIFISIRGYEKVSTPEVIILTNNVKDNIEYFHKNTFKYKKKDINQYKTFEELGDATKEAKLKLTKGEIERMAKKETDVLLNDDNYFVVIPKSHRANCYYGAGTRWCTTETDPGQFISTTHGGNLIYVIDKKRKQFVPKEKTTGSVGKGTGDKLSKIAILINKDSDVITIWDSSDAKINILEYFKNNKVITQILIKNNLLSIKQRLKYDLISKKELQQIRKNLIKQKSLAGRLSLITELDYKPEQVFSQEEIKNFNGIIEFIEENEKGIKIIIDEKKWEEYYSGFNKDDDLRIYDETYSHYGFENEFDESELEYINSYLNNDASEKIEELMKLMGRMDLIKKMDKEGIIFDFFESLPDGEDKLSYVLGALNLEVQSHLKKVISQEYENERKFDYTNLYSDKIEMFLPYDKLINVLMYNSNIKTLSQLEESQLNGEIKLHSVYEQERGNMSDEGKKYVNEEMIGVVDWYIEKIKNEELGEGQYFKNYKKLQQTFRDLNFNDEWKLDYRERGVKYKVENPDYEDGKIEVVRTNVDAHKVTRHKIPIDSLGSFVTVGTLFENKETINYKDIIKEEKNKSLCFQYPSDEIRYNIIKNEMDSDKIWDKDEIYYEEDLLNAEWLTQVLNKKDYLDYYELFIDDCWINLYNKEEYKNLSKQQAINKLVNERFKNIADKLNLEIKNWSFEDEILNIKFYKKENLKENTLDSFGSDLAPSTGNDSSIEFSHRLLGKTDSFKYDNDNDIDYNIKETINYNDLIKEHVQKLNQGAGILPFNKDTKKFLIGMRSKSVRYPKVYHLFGGKVNENETFEEGALREFKEETGFDGNMQLIKLSEDKQENFIFYSYLGIIDKEFEPKLNWETDHVRWVTLDELLKLEPKYSGFKELLDEKLNLIKRYTENKENIQEGVGLLLKDIDKEHFFKKLPKALNIQVSPENHIGKGTYGDVYKIDDKRLLKITTDIQEANAVNRIIRRKLNNVIDYYKVFRLESKEINYSNLFIIIMENVNFNKKLSIKYFVDLQKVLGELSKNYIQLQKQVGNDIDFIELDYAIQQTPIKNDDYIRLEEFIKENSSPEALELYNFMFNLHSELKTYGLMFSDLHYKNVGFKNNKLVAFDITSFGGLEVKRKIKIDEKKIINYQDLLTENEKENRINKLKTIFPRIKDNDFNKIINSDPSVNLDYSFWLLKQYNDILKGEIKDIKLRQFIEDLYKTKEDLRLFNSIKHLLSTMQQNINNYKTYKELYNNIIKQYEKKEIEKSETQKEKEIKQRESERVYEDNKWLIIIPKTQQASCLYGKGTRWCTAANVANNAFNSYVSHGIFNYVINKLNDKEKYAFYFEYRTNDVSIHDVADNDISDQINIFFNDKKELLNPLIKSAKKYKSFIPLLRLGFKDWDKYIDPNIKELHLYNNNLSSLPDSIGKLIQLKELYLSNNNLSPLPDLIGKLTKLEILSLDNNNLSSLPDSIRNLTQLKMLLLSNNNLSSLPDSIRNLIKLERLYLNKNNLSSLPDLIVNLTELNTLDLSNNNLFSIPDSIRNLTQLNHLSLSNNNLNRQEQDKIRKLLPNTTIFGLNKQKTNIKETINYNDLLNEQKNNIKKTVFIIHGWSGGANKNWFPWIKKELKEKGFNVHVFDMPNPDKPTIKDWVNILRKNIKEPDKNTYFIGHSMGVQAIFRYLETLNDNIKIGGIITIAGFFNLPFLETKEEKEIAKPWLNDNINTDKIKKMTDNIISIFSDNDPDVSLNETNLFKKRLNAKIIIQKNKEHFTNDKIPIVVKELFKITEQNYNDLLNEYYTPPEIVSLVLQIDNNNNNNNNKGYGVDEIFNKNKESLIVLDRYYSSMDSYEVEKGHLSGEEKIIDIVYDNGKLFDEQTKDIQIVENKLKEQNVNNNIKEIKYINWNNLNPEEQIDIIENVYDNSDYLKSEWNIWTFKEYFDNEIDLKIPLKIMLVNKMWEDLLKQNRGYYEKNIEKLKNIFYEKGKLDPVLIKDNKFFDGGHRLRMYKEENIKEVPAYDIGFLLRTDWKNWLEENGKYAHIIKEQNINKKDLIPDEWKQHLQIEGNNVILYHYGSEELKNNVLDPELFGQKSYTSDVKQWSQKRLFFYIKPEDREWRVTGKEYIVKYPLDKLYPFNKDPNGYYEECQKELEMKDLPINLQVSCIGQKVKENGFGGMIYKWDNTFLVTIWEKVKPVNIDEHILYEDISKIIPIWTVGNYQIENINEKDFINKILKSLKYKPVDKYYELGSGSMGKAYSIDNNKVLKLTTDKSEAKGSNKLIGKKLKYMVNYYNVIKLTSNKIDLPPNLYVIIMDYVETDFLYFQQMFDDFSSVLSKELGANFMDQMKKDIKHKNDKALEYYKNIIDNHSNEDEGDNAMELYTFMIDLYTELNKYNLDFTDLHEGNMGIRNGEWVAFDFRGWGGLKVKKQLSVKETINYSDLLKEEQKIKYPSIKEIREWIGYYSGYADNSDGNDAKFILQEFKNLSEENINIYRVVKANEVDLNNLGNHWAFDFETLKHFAKMNLSGTEKDWKIISGQIDKKDVNLEDSIKHYIQFSFAQGEDAENELTIDSDKKIKNVKINDFNNNFIDEQINDLLNENNNIQEFKHGVLNARIGDLPENIPLKIAKKLGFNQAEFINSRSWGNVYDIGLTDKLMKITTDEKEAKTSFKLVGKELKNVVKFYGVYKLESKKYDFAEDLYVIIMEKIEINQKESIKLDNNLDKAIQTYYFDNPKNNKIIDLNMLVYYLIKNPYILYKGLEQYVKSVDKKYNNGIYEYYQFIIDLARELKKYNITYGDIHSGNIGRRNGKLISFDMGVSTGGEEPKEKIKVEENNIIDESFPLEGYGNNNDIKRKEFINILNKEDISYEIKDNRSIPLDGYEIIIDGNDIESDLITYIPDNIKFNNKGGVYLSYLKEMGNNVIFNNKGDVNLYSLNKMGDNVIFNNNGKISLYSLKEVGNNIIFNNKGDVWLDTIYYFDINSVKFTNNVRNVYFGESTYWMEEFPYELYPKIKGNFKMWNSEKNKWGIIKEQYNNIKKEELELS